MSTAAPRLAVHDALPERADSSAPLCLPAKATYWLSEGGRKAALLAGFDGHAKQDLSIDVPLSRLHLVSVDAQGIARLKLQPRYERDHEERIVRIDASPTFDAPPTIDDLFTFAARNFELERVHNAERTAARSHRAEAERELRIRIASAFLADAQQRALPHPAPSPTRCYVLVGGRHRLFDVSTDEGLARDLPPEAHKRFRADLRARTERNRQQRGEQEALHLAKREAIGAWITVHGTPDQQARQRAGVLPLPEAIEALTSYCFAAAGDRSLYERDGAQRLQQHLRAMSPTYAEVVVTTADLVVTSTEATTATRSQWAVMEELRTALPSASVRLRAHRLSWRRDAHAPALTVFSISVVQKEGELFTLRREYAAAPD